HRPVTGNRNSPSAMGAVQTTPTPKGPSTSAVLSDSCDLIMIHRCREGFEYRGDARELAIDDVEVSATERLHFERAGDSPPFRFSTHQHEIVRQQQRRRNAKTRRHVRINRAPVFAVDMRKRFADVSKRRW